MKKSILVYLMLLNCLLSYSQIKTWKSNKGSLLIGGFSSGQITHARNPDTGDKFYYENIAFYPRIGMQVSKKLLIGAYGHYGWIKGNLHPNFTYSGVGYFGRYYFFPNNSPSSYDSVSRILLKFDNRVKKFIYQRVKLYAEVYHIFTNTYYSHSEITRLDSYKNQIITVGVGANILIWKNICLEYTPRISIFPVNPSYKIALMGASLGIDYFIPLKKVK